jgi:predicted transcriptional regulator
MAAFTSIAIGLALAGAATSVYGQVKAGKAQKKAGEAEQRSAESQAQLSDYNAAVADVQARDEEVRGEIDANRFRSRTRLLIGEQRAGFAAGNVDVSFGSPVDVQADAAFLGEMDALQIRTNAARAAWGIRIQGEDLRKQAEIQRAEGANAATAGKARQTAAFWGAGSTVLGAGSSLLEARYGFGRKGK